MKGTGNREPPIAVVFIKGLPVSTENERGHCAEDFNTDFKHAVSVVSDSNSVRNGVYGPADTSES